MKKSIYFVTGCLSLLLILLYVLFGWSVGMVFETSIVIQDRLRFFFSLFIVLALLIGVLSSKDGYPHFVFFGIAAFLSIFLKHFIFAFILFEMALFLLVSLLQPPQSTRRILVGLFFLSAYALGMLSFSSEQASWIHFYHAKIVVSSFDAFFIVLFAVSLLIQVICIMRNLVRIESICCSPLIASMSLSVLLTAFIFLMLKNIPLTGMVKVPMTGIAYLLMAYGALKPLREDNLFRRISESFFFFLGLFVLLLLSGKNLMYFFMTFTFTLWGLTNLLNVWDEGGARLQVKDVSGLYHYEPYKTLCFSIILLSSVGFIPGMGFYGRLIIFQQMIVSEQSISLIFIGLASLFLAYQYLSLVIHLFFATEFTEKPRVFPFASLATVTFCSIGILFWGLWPKHLIVVIEESLKSLY
jgi:hypothetical protein